MRDWITTLGTIFGLAVIVFSLAQWNGIVAGVVAGGIVVGVAELEGRR